MRELGMVVTPSLISRYSHDGASPVALDKVKRLVAQGRST